MTTSFHGVPAFGVIYGPSKVGKTTAMLFSFPRALFIAQRGALKPSLGVVGYAPREVEVQTIPEATALIRAVTKKDDEDAVVVDDFSLLADQTVRAIEARKITGWAIWGVLRDYVLDLRDAARNAGRHVFLTAHESAPRTFSGQFIRGGPKLPGRLPEDLPAACDIVLRLCHDPSADAAWPVVARCTATDPAYITGDRHGVTPDPAPPNPAEILRAAGYTVQRLKSLEYQEGIIEKAAAGILNGVDERAVFEAATAHMRAKYGATDLAIRWALRDARHRVVLRRARGAVLTGYV